MSFFKNKKLKKQNKKNIEMEDKKYNIFDKAMSVTDIIAPDILEENRDHIYLGPNKLLRVYAIIGYPRQMTVGFLNDISSLGGIDVSTYIEPIPDDRIISKLTSRYSQLKSNLNLQIKHGYAPDYGVAHAADDLDALRELIQTNKERMFYSQSIILIWGSNLSELDSRSNILNDLCARKSLKIRCLVYEQKAGFSTSLPLLDLKYTKYLRNMTTGAIASLIPLGNTQLSHKNGILFGRNINTGSYIFYDNFIGSPELTNPHTFISGTTGAGKSVFCKLKSARGTASGRWSIILDPQGEYKKEIAKLGGQYIELQAGEKSGINPFDLEVEQDNYGKKKVDLYGKRTEIINMISVFSSQFTGKPLRGQLITAVDEVTASLYANLEITENPDDLYIETRVTKNGKFLMGKIKKSMPVLSNLREGLVIYNEDIKSKELTELTEVMKMITGDGPMAIFDCQSTINIKNRIIAINFKDLKDDFTKFFAILNTMSWIWSKFSNWKLKDLYKDVYIDEGSLFTKYKESLAFIDHVARLGRKFHIALNLATQFIEDFINSDQGRAIVALCATKVILKQEASVAQQTADFFGLSYNCKNFIQTFTSGQAILLTEKDLVLMQITPEEFEWEFAKTN